MKLSFKDFLSLFVDSYFKIYLFIFSESVMGCFGSKDKLSKEDMDFLKTHTRYDEATIKEWYKGFKVSNFYIKKKEKKNFSS